MSTNFYLKRKIPTEKKLYIISNIENDKWDKASELVSEAKEESNIHPIYGFAKAFGFGMAYIIEDDFGHRELTSTNICSPANRRFIEKHYQRFVSIEEVIEG